MTKALSSWPNFDEEQANAARDIILSNKVNYWTGETSREFEKEYAAWTNVKHAIAVANGTLALDLALKALDIGPGDEVIVTPRTFIASISCVVTAGAIPVFADVDRDSGNISPTTIKNVISERTKAIIPVHLAGWPCDMDGIMLLANQHELSVIEDCAQAHGAKINGRHVGSIGHIGAWSFCQDKIMTTGGEGGMVTTNNSQYWERMWSYKDHGKNWNAVYEQEHPPGFRWLHDSFGTNWRILEVQSAIGRIQLKRMAVWNKIRTRNAQAIQTALAPFESSVRVPVPLESFQHAYYKQYGYIRMGGLKSGWTRDRIVSEINALGFPAFQGSCSEVYLEKAFDNTGWRPKQRLPTAKELGETSVMFLTHPSINEQQIAAYCETIGNVFRQATL